MSNEDCSKLFSLSDSTCGGGKSLWGVWQTNCLPLSSYRASAVFPTVSRLNHSCRPNAHHEWCPEEGRERVWAAEDVKQGEEVSYLHLYL